MSQDYRILQRKVGAIGDIALDEIRKEVQAKGSDCTWEKAIPCPCYRVGTLEGSTVPDASTTTPQGDCPACRGDGWVYYGAQAARFLITGASNRLDDGSTAGLSTPGMVNVSAFVETPICLGDRITVLDVVRTCTQQQIRGAGATDTLRFPIVDKEWTISTALDTWVPEIVTIGVDYLIAADTTGTIIGGASPTEYVEGVNFEIAAGLIDWTIGGIDVPAAGTRYTARYYARPRYIINNLRYAHRQLGFGEKLPPPDHREVRQLFWQGSAVLDSLGTA